MYYLFFLEKGGVQINRSMPDPGVDPGARGSLPLMITRLHHNKLMYTTCANPLCKAVLLLLTVGEGWVALSMHPEEYPP